MLKAKLRKIALQERMSLSLSEFEDLNQQLLSRFKQLNFAGIKAVHFFLPILEKREPNTFLLIEWLQKNFPEINIVIPKADFSNNTLSNHLYLGMDYLVKNEYNILEPSNTALFNDKIDMVFLPLLAFDSRGYRVGYGKGFYDRFLSTTNAQKIGLSLFNCIDLIEDIHENDIRLDFCITPTKTITF